jgi:hypothetical protein
MKRYYVDTRYCEEVDDTQLSPTRYERIMVLASDYDAACRERDEEIARICDLCAEGEAEFLAENERLRELVAGQDDGGHWYSQASMDAVVRERDRLREALEQQRGGWMDGYREGMRDS